MKLDALNQQLQNDGAITCTGEYRTHKIRDIEWTDKATGKKLSFTAVEHAIEFGATPGKEVTRFVVDDKRDDTVTSETYKCPYKKGDKVVVEITFCGFVKGRGEAYKGKIHLADGK